MRRSRPSTKTTGNTILAEIQNSHIGTILQMMDVAEELIQEYKHRYPDQKQIIHESFTVLRPSKYLGKAPMKLYRVHAEELIHRVIQKDPLEPATDAELLIAFKEMSLQTPLHAEAATAYFRLFKKHFPDAFPNAETMEYESYPGSIEETYQEMRQKLAVPRT